MFRVAVPWLIASAVLFIAGGAMYVLADGVLQALSLWILGVAGVVGVSGLFYAVGVSEDRDRERENRRRRRP